jgi:hypothetical protein
MASEARWPLTREQQELLVMLASLIQRFGSERFLEAKLVRADKKDFPDKWEGTLQSVHQVLYRLCWHAHFDAEIVVEDHRPPQDAFTMLRTSEIEIASCAAGTATFHVTAIGNDDVAGALAHKVGEVFLDFAPGEPFRSSPRIPDEREASVAAVFLGLGVPAANAALYRRHASEIRGRDEYSESKIATAGGLDIADITLLLAIQDILRDDVQDALSTLHGAQRDWVEQWKQVLDPHEDELRESLALDEKRDPRPLARPPAPRTAPASDEKARLRVNVGRETMRVRKRSFLGTGAGMCLGAFGLLAIPALGPLGMALGGATLAGGTLVGWALWSQPYYLCSDGECGKLIGANDSKCPHCGGEIAKTISEKELQAHWRQLRAEEDARDEELDESEFAGDPDADVLKSQREPARANARMRHSR